LQGTYAVLHQNLLPCVSAPGLNWLVTKVCRAQIENMLKDLKQEIRRVNKGVSLLDLNGICCCASSHAATALM
jgi:hypothetical protein